MQAELRVGVQAGAQAPVQSVRTEEGRHGARVTLSLQPAGRPLGAGRLILRPFGNDVDRVDRSFSDGRRAEPAVLVVGAAESAPQASWTRAAVRTPSSAR